MEIGGRGWVYYVKQEYFEKESCDVVIQDN